MTRSTRNPEADYTPNDMGPPEHHFSYEEIEYRKDLMDKIAAGRDPEIEMLEERLKIEPL